MVEFCGFPGFFRYLLVKTCEPLILRSQHTLNNTQMFVWGWWFANVVFLSYRDTTIEKWLWWWNFYYNHKYTTQNNKQNRTTNGTKQEKKNSNKCWQISNLFSLFSLESASYLRAKQVAFSSLLSGLGWCSTNRNVMKSIEL